MEERLSEWLRLLVLDARRVPSVQQEIGMGSGRVTVWDSLSVFLLAGTPFPPARASHLPARRYFVAHFSAHELRNGTVPALIVAHSSATRCATVVWRRGSLRSWTFRAS